jgi:hypothetical protein
MASYVPSIGSFKKQSLTTDREKLEKDQVSRSFITGRSSITETKYENIGFCGRLILL